MSTLEACGRQPIAQTQKQIHSFWTPIIFLIKQWLILTNWGDLTHIIHISTSLKKMGRWVTPGSCSHTATFSWRYRESSPQLFPRAGGNTGP